MFISAVRVVLCLLVPVSLRAADESSPKVDRAAGGGFVELTNRGGVWSFVKDGKGFQSLAVSHVCPKDEGEDPNGSYDVLARTNGNRTRWAQEVRQRLEGWGFNTAGAWCDDALYAQPMPHTRVIWFGGNFATPDMRLIDVFTDEYAQGIERTAVREVEPHKNDPWLIGYFNNNELPFYGERGWPTTPDRSLLDRYLELPAGSPGKARLVAFFRETYPAAGAASRDWEEPAGGWDKLGGVTRLQARTLAAQRVKNLWAGVVAERYFSLCEAAIRRHDPNHLILGCRYAGKPLRAVAEAEGAHADVISINHYQAGGIPDMVMLHNLSVLTGRPVLISEYSWRANENTSGNRNRGGAEVTVKTQAERGERFEGYTSTVMAAPYIVGVQWFQYFDQPTEGRRVDGEDGNYGLVDVHDQPYGVLIDSIRRVSAKVVGVSRHAEPFTFDEDAWGESVGVRLPVGTLSQPAEVALNGESCRIVKADVQNGCRAEWKFGSGAPATFSYQSKAGWGAHGDVSLPESFRAMGARSVKMEFVAPKGLRLVVFVTEIGDGEPGMQVYQGRRGSDGESYELPTIVATGEPQQAIFPLDQGVLRHYWGNQRGNHVLDLDGLRCLSVLVPGGQGAGEISIQHLTLIP